MAVVLRFRRSGANKRPYYRLVACDSRKPREGSFLEKLGHYDPRKEKDGFIFNKERIVFWLDKGATPSDRVHIFLKKCGIMSEWKGANAKAKAEKKAAKTAK